MWSRIRHRRLQALSLLTLAALLTTCLCLGPLYQRAMEQALTGSELANASPSERSLRLTSVDRSATELEELLPARLDPYFADPTVSLAVNVTLELPNSDFQVVNRLYAVNDACQRLELAAGTCPSRAGEVMVSTADLEINGWTVGSRVDFTERLPASQFDHLGTGTLTIVGVYELPEDEAWLDAPITGKAGTVLKDVGFTTDDWVTSPDTLTSAAAPTPWQKISSSVVWSLDVDAVDHDSLVRIGPVVEQVRENALGSTTLQVLPVTDLPGLSERVETGSDQGRTTVVVLVAQLLVLVAVVLWMVLVAATDDRRLEVALARLRGRGRRGAAAYLLTELLPLTLLGVAAGLLLAPFVMRLVAQVVFPVPVPLELPGGYLLAAAAAVLTVLVVVLAAARRAVREPVASLLRAVPAGHSRAGAGRTEVAITVFSLSAVAVLVTGNLEGPLATLAPTLLAVAVGLLLARVLGPPTRIVSRRMLRRGRAVPAAGVITAVRRPAARRVLVMVVVATALVAFCVDALVTGQHNRQNAAEQRNGAAYSFELQSGLELDQLGAALEAADPGREHVTPVVTTTNNGTRTAPTVAVDPTAFSRVAYFPLSRPGQHAWDAIRAPDVEPVRFTGKVLDGTVASTGVHLTGPAKKRVDELKISLQLLEPGDRTGVSALSVIPTADGTTTFSVPVPCEEGCIVTGIGVSGPIGGRIEGTVVLRDLAADGQPFSLGDPTGWRRMSDPLGASVIPATDPAGNLGVLVKSEFATPPAMLSAWVPDPVPVLVSGDETGVFEAQGTGGQIDLTTAGTLPRVPGSPLGARVVDLEGLLRRPEHPDGNYVVEVWANDADALDRARTELEERGATLGPVTSVDEVRAELDASPAAWSLALAVLVGLIAVLLAALVMIVSTATTWRARAADLAALRMAGLPGRSLRRLELLGQLPGVVVGGVVGAVCGVVAAVLSVPGIRQFTDPPEVETTDFSTPWAAVVVAAVAALVVLTALAVATSRWTAKRAPLRRIREVV